MDALPSDRDETTRLMTPDRVIRVELLLDKLGFREFYGAASTAAAGKCLSRLDNSTLDLVDRACDWNSAQGFPRFKFMFHVITRLDESTMREVLFYFPSYRGDQDTDEAIGYVMGLHSLAYFSGMKNLDTLTGEDFEVAAAFLNITATLDESFARECLEEEYSEGDNLPSIFINNDVLHDLIVDHYDKAEQIIQFIRERDTEDASVIREYLEKHSALSTGIL